MNHGKCAEIRAELDRLGIDWIDVVECSEEIVMLS